MSVPEYDPDEDHPDPGRPASRDDGWRIAATIAAIAGVPLGLLVLLGISASWMFSLERWPLRLAAILAPWAAGVLGVARLGLPSHKDAWIVSVIVFSAASALLAAALGLYGALLAVFAMTAQPPPSPPISFGFWFLLVVGAAPLAAAAAIGVSWVGYRRRWFWLSAAASPLVLAAPLGMIGALLLVA